MSSPCKWTPGVAKVNVEIKLPDTPSPLKNSDDKSRYVTCAFARTGGQRRQVAVTNTLLLYTSGDGKFCRSIPLDKQSNSEKVNLKLGEPNQSATITDMVSLDSDTAICDSSGTVTILSGTTSKTTDTFKHPDPSTGDYFKQVQWVDASQLFLLSLSSSNKLYELTFTKPTAVVPTEIQAVTFSAKRCDNLNDPVVVALLTEDQSHVKIAIKNEEGWSVVLTSPELHGGDAICGIHWAGNHLITMSGGRLVTLRFWEYTPADGLTLSLTCEYLLPHTTCHATDGVISGDGGNRAMIYWPGYSVPQLSVELRSPGVVKMWRVDADDLLEAYVTQRSGGSPVNGSITDKPTHIVALFGDSLCRTEWGGWSDASAVVLVPKPLPPPYSPTVIPPPKFEADDAQTRILRELGALKASVLTMDANCRMLTHISDRLNHINVRNDDALKTSRKIPHCYSSMSEESHKKTQDLNVGSTDSIITTVRENIAHARVSLVSKQTETLCNVIKSLTADRHLQTLNEFSQNVFTKVLSPEVRGLLPVNQVTVRTLIESEFGTIQELEKQVMCLLDSAQMQLLAEFASRTDEVSRSLASSIVTKTESTRARVGETCLPFTDTIRDLGLSNGIQKLETDFESLQVTHKEIISDLERAIQEEKLLREDSILPEDSISFMCEPAPPQAPERSKWETYISMGEYNKCIYEINDLTQKDECYDTELEWFRERTFNIRDKLIQKLTIEGQVILMRDAAVSLESSGDCTSPEHVEWIITIGTSLDTEAVHKSSSRDYIIPTLEWVSNIITLCMATAEGELLSNLEMIQINLQCI